MTDPKHQEDSVEESNDELPSAADDTAADDTAADAAPESQEGDAVSRAPMTKGSLAFLIGVSVLGLALDLGTKAWAVATLHSGAMEIHPATLTLRLAYNPGGAFSMLASVEAIPRRFFFVAVSLFAIYFILRLYRRLNPSQRALRWGLPLVLAGALGNLTDRVVRGEVVDFIEYRGAWLESVNGIIHAVYSPWMVTDQWPTFNVADIWICTGVVLMLIDSWRPHRGRVPDENDSVAQSAS